MDLETILQAVNVGGVVAVLVVIFVLFMRGDLLPRKVWEELTRKTIIETVDKIAQAVCERLNEVKTKK